MSGHLCMNLLNCQVYGVFISVTERGNAPTVLLNVGNGDFIPIYIGLWEAISITNALHHHTLPRPIAHDLFSDLFNRFTLSLEAIHIDVIEDGVFFAKLIVKKDEHEETLDCRPSDGIAIALRLKAPILIAEEVVKKASVNRDELQKMVDIKDYL